MFITAEAHGQKLHYVISFLGSGEWLRPALPASQFMELSSYFWQSYVSVYMLDSMKFLKLASKVPVHNFHLFL